MDDDATARADDADAWADGRSHGSNGWMMTPRLGPMDDAKVRADGRSQGSDRWKKPRFGSMDDAGVWMMTPRLGRMEEAKARMN